MDQNELQLIEDSISDINDTVIDINKDIAYMKDILGFITLTFVIGASIKIGYFLGVRVSHSYFDL